MWKTLALALLMIAVLGSVAAAEELSKITDNFFAGLAEVIEGNMEDPGECLGQVEEYYRQNQATIAKIREETAKAMALAAPMMNEMMQASFSQDEEKLKALEKKYQGMAKGMPQERIQPGADRYAKALEDFTARYPQYGMQVAMKSMELMPNLNPNQYLQKGQ
jgi:hypothetical protein